VSGLARWSRWLLFAALALAGAAYLAFSHLLTVAEHPNLLMLAVGVTPLVAMAVLAAWHAPMRWLALSLLALLALAVLWYLDELRDHLPWLYFMQHAGAMSLLAITFGSTLWREPADALCSRIARLMLPSPVDPAYMRYTWKVTLVWAVYFCASAVLSVLLFFWGPIAIWSYFANLLTPVLIGLLFVVEYLVRVRLLPERAHFSIAQTIRAYRSYDKR
jgi:uncharacterized membrane protein